MNKAWSRYHGVKQTHIYRPLRFPRQARDRRDTEITENCVVFVIFEVKNIKEKH